MGYKPRKRYETERVVCSDPEKRRELGVYSPLNCPKATYTGDGTPVGRCWYWLGPDGNTCPVHGDVSQESWLIVRIIPRR